MISQELLGQTQQLQQLDRCLDIQLKLSETQVMQQDAQNSAIASIVDRFGGFANQASSFHHNTNETLNTIGTRLDHLPATSVLGFDAVRSQLEKIYGRVSARNVSVETCLDCSAEYLHQCDTDELKNALHRLSELAHEQGRQSRSVEAEDVLSDIDVLLRSLLVEHGAKGYGRHKRKRDALFLDDDENEVLYWRPLKMLKSVVDASHSIYLNRKGECAFWSEGTG